MTKRLILEEQLKKAHGVLSLQNCNLHDRFNQDRVSTLNLVQLPGRIMAKKQRSLYTRMPA